MTRLDTHFLTKWNNSRSKDSYVVLWNRGGDSTGYRSIKEISRKGTRYLPLLFSVSQRGHAKSFKGLPVRPATDRPAKLAARNSPERGATHPVLF